MTRIAAILLVAVVIGAVAACSEESQAPTPLPEPTAVVAPPLNVSIRSVDLADIVFDRFDGGFVPFPEASDQLIAELTDAIPPIYQPEYGGAEEGDWLNDRELVIGYMSNGVSYAYPIRMLNFHELVADEIDGIPLLVTY